MSKTASVFGLVFLLILVSCGGGNSSNTDTGGNSTGSQSTTGAAQGVYSGTSSNGYSFSTIVLPNDKFYGIYGTMNGNTLLLAGMVTGQGTSSSTKYTANVSDFYYTGTLNTGSLSASYVAGSSINGTLTEGSSSTTFTGTALSASDFNYNAAASLSTVTGAWTGTLLDGSSTSVTISSTGSFTGTSTGCPLSGTVTADSSGKNFFDVSVTFGNSNACQFPNQTATGIAVEYLLSNGVTHQLLAGVTVGTSLGTVFVANR